MKAALDPANVNWPFFDQSCFCTLSPSYNFVACSASLNADEFIEALIRGFSKVRSSWRISQPISGQSNSIDSHLCAIEAPTIEMIFLQQWHFDCPNSTFAFWHRGIQFDHRQHPAAETSESGSPETYRTSSASWSHFRRIRSPNFHPIPVGQLIFLAYSFCLLGHSFNSYFNSKIKKILF